MKSITPKTKLIINICFIVSLLLISGVLYFCLNGGAEGGAWVVVRVNGENLARYSLSVNGTYELNGGTNTLVVENGCCWLIDANCPDKLCVKQGKIRMEGQCITCLPNKLTVTLYGAEKGPDIIVY